MSETVSIDNKWIRFELRAGRKLRARPLLFRLKLEV